MDRKGEDGLQGHSTKNKTCVMRRKTASHGEHITANIYVSVPAVDFFRLSNISGILVACRSAYINISIDVLIY